MSRRFDSPLRTTRTTRVVRKKVKLDDGKGTIHSTYVDDGVEEFTYEVNIDWKEITGEMVFSAVTSKGGKCQRGPIQVRIASRRKIS